MSVLIDSYCRTNDNEFTRLLKKCLDDGIFFYEDCLNFYNSGKHTIAEIQIDYTLYWDDLSKFQKIIGNRGWGIRPTSEENCYKLFVNLLISDI